MQPSNGGSRIKLNRSAFMLEKDSVPKRRRLSRSSGSECTDPTGSKVSTARAGSAPRDPSRAAPGPQDAHHHIPSHITGYDQGVLASHTSVRPSEEKLEPSRASCTLRDCRNNKNSATPRKQVRCHLHLALRFCGSQKPATEAEQSVSCTMSHFVNGDVRVQSSSSSGDAIEPHAGSAGMSVANQGVSNSAVKTDKIQLGAPEKKDGQDAHLRPNFNRKAGLRKHFGSISRLGSGTQVKRSVKNACCALCGDVKYTPPARKKLAHAYTARSRHPSWPGRLEQPIVHPVAMMTARLIIWFRRHLKVKLCDVAHVFDVTSRDFSCILPAVLLQKRKHKRVKCFTKEFRSLMRLDPQGNGKCGKWIGSQSWEVCTPTNSCASLSSGNQVLGFSVGEHILDVAEDIEGWSESSDKQVLRMPDCEKMKLSSIEGTACVPLKDGEVQHCVETAGYMTEDSRASSEIQEGKAAPVHRVPPLLLRRVHACNGFASSQRFQHVDLADNFTVSEADTNDNCLVENGLNNSSEVDVNSPDCFSCQRTTAYMVWPRLSCARTYRSWPFPRHGPPCEMKSSIRTGPRWIATTEASEGKNNVINNIHIGFSTSSECTVGKNMKESLIGFEPHNGSVQNSQGQVQSTAQRERVQAPPTLEETSKDQSKCQKNPGKASVSSEGEHFKHSCNVFQQDPPSLGSVHEIDSQTSPEVLNSEMLNVISAGSSSAVDTKSVDLGDYSMNGTQSSMSSKCSEDNENGTEATTFHLPDPLPDLQRSASQTLSCIVHSREEPLTHTVLVRSNMEPKHPSSLMVHHKEEEKSDTDIENRRQCSLNILHTKTADQNTSSPSCTGGSSWDTPFKTMINGGSFSSSVEDISSLSPAERPEEGDAECLLLQEKMCKIGKANRSPLHAPKGSVVTSTDLDVVRAYEDDAIVLDVIQDDPDLFGDIMGTAGNLASNSNPVQRGKNMCMPTDQTTLARKPNRIVWGLKSERKNVQTAGDAHVETPVGFCRGDVNELAKGSKSQLAFGRKWAPVNPIVKPEQIVPDSNNNLDMKESTDMNVSTVNTGSTWLVDDARNNVHTTAGKDINVVRPSSYCWYYFNERYSCVRNNVCWFLHVPKDNDEKFCMDIIQKFCRVGSPPIVKRAVEIFVAYYGTNSPGACFSQNIVNQLLSSLLSLALLWDLLSVINTLLTHKRMPPVQFVMALYEHVRERGILNFVPELLHLTSKITEVGCVFSVEQCEMMQLHLESLHLPRHQMDIFCAVKCRALATNPHTAELSELAQFVVQVELCKQQEDWPALARMFCTVCCGRHSAGELSRFCCCVTMALLKEPKDKLTLPYEIFAESVCQEVPSDEMVKSFLGRIGVSLMFSYHRTQDWTKGLKLLCVMSRLQVEFTMLKGLFSSENGTSRCQLVTIATEFFINSGSIEGALNMLKANEWFVSSSTWPCEQADVQNRRRVLTLLAEKTSYRDTLEVLINLPGLRQPVDGVQMREYNTMFNTHLRRCVMNQVLPVAADTLEFMLTRGIPPETSELQHLIHKLGKQNSWSRARTLFKRAHFAGYYSEVVCEKDCLSLPCCLSEIEMTLAFEMFIACICTSLHNSSNASQPLLITLKRRTGNEVAMESLYLAAGSRLLSAALIPNPKLSIRYTAVNQEQEQLFKLDRGSAAKWLSHNRWAQGMWPSSQTHSHKPKLPFNNCDPDGVNMSSQL